MKFNRAIGFILSALLFCGCASKLSVQKSVNFNPGNKTLTVAVLPISAKPKQQQTARQVREEIAANLQEGNYLIAEISDVDRKLEELGLTDPKKLKGMIEQGRIDLKEDLGVDAVLCGRIIEWSKTYLAIHGDVELDVELNLYDAQNGTKLANVRKGVIKSSGITRVPTGYISAGTAPVLGLRKSVQQQVIHTLTREITAPLIALAQGESSN